MAKNGQMHELLLCAGIILVVLFFWSVFKMKEGFGTGCSTRSETGCTDSTGCSWNSDTSKCELSLPCSSLVRSVCRNNSDVCRWSGTAKAGSCGNI